ncbi:MAG: hypothetical protein Q9226_004551 [Calogaya cf. arnoldii]
MHGKSALQTQLDCVLPLDALPYVTSPSSALPSPQDRKSGVVLSNMYVVASVFALQSFIVFVALDFTQRF